MIEGLGFVRLEVADLERSIAFYRDGLRFGYEGCDEGQALLARFGAGDLHVVLVESTAHRDSRGAGISLSVEVSGVDAYYDALVARGLTPTRPLDDAESRRFTIRDPDGYRWAFIQSLA